MVPGDTLLRRLSSWQVSAIQVTVVTAVIPPGAFIALGTVTTTVTILVSVLGRESLTIVIVKAVTWKHTDWLYYNEIINQAYQVVN